MFKRDKLMYNDSMVYNNRNLYLRTDYNDYYVHCNIVLWYNRNQMLGYHRIYIGSFCVNINFG